MVALSALAIGNERHCMICFAKLPPGTIEILQAMYGDKIDTSRQRFVRRRIHVERKGLTKAQTKELEMGVWRAVARSISGFVPNRALKADGAFAWLKMVVKTVVWNYAQQKATKAEALEVKDWDAARSPMTTFDAAGDLENPLFAQKVTPEGDGPDSDDAPDQDSYDPRPGG
jgi:hypothetical protein